MKGNLRTIRWSKNAIKIIDQSELPLRLKYIYIKDLDALWQAIKTMKVRGAPVLGAAAGLGMYLAVKDSKAKNFYQFNRELDRAAKYIASSRPTARNLFWALERMQRTALENRKKPLSAIKHLLFEQAQAIIEEDRSACRKIGAYAASLIRNNDTILTICNAGMLATVDYGTALAGVYRSKEQGKSVNVYACETRPMLQGARLTCWELSKNNIPVTLICDNTAPVLMRQGRIDKVFAGADRICANADTANKIGTYNLAVLANHHKIPFYIAAPSSTFDLSIKSGEDIPIEQRNESEITRLFFTKPVAPKGVKALNPAFDVTPHQLISAIITEKGIIRPPFAGNIAKKIALRDGLN